MYKRLKIVGIIALWITIILLPSVACGDDVWCTMPTPTGDHLLGVWVNSSIDAFAVGYSVTLHYDGTEWTQMSGGSGGTDVWASSGSDVFVAGGGIYHYDGTNWTQMPGPTGVCAVWGSSGSDVFAVGNNVIFHYDGTDWTQMNCPVVSELKSVWGSSGSDVFAVGSYPGVILHYDGTEWTQMTCYVGDLLDVWGSSGSDVFAVQVTSIVHHYNGINWIPMWGLPPSGGLCCVWGSSGSNVFVTSPPGFILHYDGTEWTRVRPTTNCLHNIWGSSGRDIFAVGNSGTIIHYGPEALTVSVPDTTCGSPASTVIVPVNTEDLTGLGIVAVEFTLSFDSTIITGIDVDTSGTLLSGTDWTCQFNAVGDTVYVDMSGTDELAGTGNLINLLFAVSPDAGIGDDSPLHFVDFVFNQGTPWTVNKQDGVFVVVLVDVDEPIEPSELAKVILDQNYPNPLFALSEKGGNPQTTISYTLSQSGMVSLMIYNIKGQLVETLVNDVQQSGYHSVVWNAKDMIPGIYLYRITAGDFTDTKKCIILK